MTAATTPQLPHQAFATPSGTGVKGPGGALVIRARKPSAAIASQNVSQKPSI